MDDVIERYEFKYLVSERLVPKIREAVRTTSSLDRHAGADGTYRIRSLYFDTPGFDLYRANERQAPDRFKMRARVYPGKESPIFLEVKRRVLDVIIKSRAALPKDTWRDVLSARGAALDALPPSIRQSTLPFLARLHRHHLEPVMLIEYEREPYESQFDSYARVTFDRKIVVQPKDTLDIEADPTRWRPVDDITRTGMHDVVTVLELKFERRPPAWMVALVKRLDLVRYSFSKYCYGVMAEKTFPELRSPVPMSDGF